MPGPNFQDRVKHKTSAEVVTGTVIAKYQATIEGKDMILLDVRSDDDRIYWATPAENWEVVQAYEET